MRHLCLVSLLFVFMIAWDCNIATSQIASAILRKGEPVPGSSSEAEVVSFRDTSQNSKGGFAISVETSGGGFHFYGRENAGEPFRVLRSNGNLDGIEQENLRESFGLADDGSLFYTCIPTNDSIFKSAWKDSTAFLLTGDPIPGIGTASTVSFAGQTYDGISFGRLQIRRQSKSSLSGLYFDTPENLLIWGGQEIPGLGRLETEYPVWDKFEFSSRGSHYIANVDLDVGGPWSNDAVVLDGAPLLFRGQVVRADNMLPGTPFRIGQIGTVDVNEAGDHFFTCSTDKGTSLLIRNDEILLRSGEEIDGFPISIGTIQVNDAGDWAMAGLIRNSFGSGVGIVVNGNLVLKRDDPFDYNGDGVIDENDGNRKIFFYEHGRPKFSLGERDANGDVLISFAIDVAVLASTIDVADFSPVSSFSVLHGDLISGTEDSLADNDGESVLIRRGDTDSQSRVWVEFEGMSPTESPTGLEFTLKNSVLARGQISQMVEFFDFQSNSWEVIDTRNAARFTDEVTNVSATGDISRFIETESLTLRARVQLRSSSNRQQFSSTMDHVFWTTEN